MKYFFVKTLVNISPLSDRRSGGKESINIADFFFDV